MTAEIDQMQKAIFVTRVNLFDHYPVGLYAAVTGQTQMGRQYSWLMLWYL